MDAYINDRKGSIEFHVGNRGLSIVFRDDFNKKETILNVQEYEISESRDTLQINEVIIKNHAEYQGVVDSLISARVIHKRTVKMIECGFIKYGVYQLTPNSIKEIYRQNNIMQIAG